ncbi:CBS domain-containing protein [Povalibacter sp.]|uniref:CBS domain-containing protein n=1 Tax=Povalibacter sp. TaxID=1962978 RepID=UPI002F3FE8E4
MKVEQYCKHGAIAIAANADIVDAARLMRERHVGFLVVFADGDPLRKPVGVLTDRDIVLQVTAREVDPHAVTVGDVMTAHPIVAHEGDDLGDLIRGMQVAGVRRAPVIDARGALKGVIAVDDVIDIVAGLLGNIAGSIRVEQKHEWLSRRV